VFLIHGNNLVDPEDSSINNSRITLLKELEEDLLDIAIFKTTHHAKENINISGPAAFDAGYEDSTESGSITGRLVVIIEVSSITPKNSDRNNKDRSEQERVNGDKVEGNEEGDSKYTEEVVEEPEAVVWASGSDWR